MYGCATGGATFAAVQRMLLRHYPTADTSQLVLLTLGSLFLRERSAPNCAEASGSGKRGRSD